MVEHEAAQRGFISARPEPRPAALAGKWGSQSDGTFVNPIVPADYSDIDAIAHDGHYYAISSTIHLSPGMTILKSADLVNWRTTGHAVADTSVIDPGLSWRSMSRHGRGVWAGALRFHLGRFYIYFASPETGLQMTSAASMDGPWDPLHCVWAGANHNDPCPHWDENGDAWMVMTRFAGDPVDPRLYTIFLFRMSPDGRSLDFGSAIPIQHSRGAEASKLYRFGDDYYLFFSEVHEDRRVCMCKRAKTLLGLADAVAVQLNEVDPKIDKEPNQGAFLKDAAGAWWFLTHQGTGDWEGRALCLLPVTWRDRWPIIGLPGADGVGTMVWQSPGPVGMQPGSPPDLNDDFTGKTLRPHWEWSHAARRDCWSLTEEPGRLRLRAFRPAREGFLGLGNVVSQRAWRTAENRVEVRLDYCGMLSGQRAGLCHMSREFVSIEVEFTEGRARLVCRYESTRHLVALPLSGKVWLATRWSELGAAEFAYSLDGLGFAMLGETSQLQWGHYRGDRVGLFTTTSGAELGHADFDGFKYSIAGPEGIPDPARTC
jgi:beta-xylosidase